MKKTNFNFVEGTKIPTNSKLTYTDTKQTSKIRHIATGNPDIEVAVGDRVLKMKKQTEVDKLKKALIWCSGSQDFQIEGKARRGWERICVPLLKSKQKTMKKQTNKVCNNCSQIKSKRICCGFITVENDMVTCSECGREVVTLIGKQTSKVVDEFANKFIKVEGNRLVFKASYGEFEEWICTILAKQRDEVKKIVKKNKHCKTKGCQICIGVEETVAWILSDLEELKLK